MGAAEYRDGCDRVAGFIGSAHNRVFDAHAISLFLPINDARNVLFSIIERLEFCLESVDLRGLPVDVFDMAMEHRVVVGDIACNLAEQLVEPFGKAVGMLALCFGACFAETP